MARVRFYGAAREVTGSLHIVENDGHTIALDCGLFQGRRAEAERKNREFPFDPRKLDAVVLSHAHIDHCGKLPKLYAEGFRGPIYATEPTRDLVEIMLADSAHIQQEDAFYLNKKRLKRGEPPIQPLYTEDEAKKAAALVQGRRLHDMFNVVPGIRAEFHEAGHMLGSAGVLLHLTNGSNPVRLVFTGDLGRPSTPILEDPEPLPACDYLICESTYGGRVTPEAEGTKEQFLQVLLETFERGGKVIVPSFAVGRTQALVYYYHQLVTEGRVPRTIPLIVDSPLALRATDVYRNHPESFDDEASAFNHSTGDMLTCAKCEYVQNVEESKALHGRPGPLVIVSASGMCEAGRILHHLKNNITDARNTVLIVGFQPANTLGRRLVERHRRVRILGEFYDVRARVKVLNGFSSHANADELAKMTAPLARGCRRAFLVHGEPDQSEALAATMNHHGFEEVTIPEAGAVFELK